VGAATSALVEERVAEARRNPETGTIIWLARVREEEEGLPHLPSISITQLRPAFAFLVKERGMTRRGCSEEIRGDWELAESIWEGEEAYCDGCWPRVEVVFKIFEINQVGTSVRSHFF